MERNNKNLHISGVSHDTRDNVVYRTQTNRTDWRGIALLISALAIILTFVWIACYVIARIHCWDAYECNIASYILIGYPLSIAAGLIIGISFSIPILIEHIRNIGYLDWRGVKTHRDDLRLHADKIIDVAKTSAKSEGTAGLDTFNPSVSRTITVKEKEDNKTNVSDNEIADIESVDILLNMLNSQILNKKD